MPERGSVISAQGDLTRSMGVFSQDGEEALRIGTAAAKNNGMNPRDS